MSEETTCQLARARARGHVVRTMNARSPMFSLFEDGR
jgi:hypothetical protein